MLVGALCGLLFLVAGGLAYAGRGRSIVLKGFPTPVLFFGLAWLGAGGLVVILSSQLSQAGHPFAGTLLALPGVVGVVVFLLSFAWMPRRLQPRWYRDWCDRGRNHAEYPPLATRVQRRRSTR
jgi:hypothetical protein